MNYTHIIFFIICVSLSPFVQLRFGIVNTYGTSCVPTSRGPRRFSNRQFDPCNPHVESACLLSEVLGRCHIGILDFTTLTQLVRVDLRHSRTIRSSPLRAPLLTLVAEPSPGGSIWTSLGVPMWSLFPSRPFPLPGRPPSPPRLRLGKCPRPGALGMSGLLQWGLLAVCASLVPMQAMACTIHPRPLDFGYLCITRENPEGYPRACPPRKFIIANAVPNSYHLGSRNFIFENEVPAGAGLHLYGPFPAEGQSQGGHPTQWGSLGRLWSGGCGWEWSVVPRVP